MNLLVYLLTSCTPLYYETFWSAGFLPTTFSTLRCWNYISYSTDLKLQGRALSAWHRLSYVAVFLVFSWSTVVVPITPPSVCHTFVLSWAVEPVLWTSSGPTSPLILPARTVLLTITLPVVRDALGNMADWSGRITDKLVGCTGCSTYRFVSNMLDVTNVTVMIANHIQPLSVLSFRRLSTYMNFHQRRCYSPPAHHNTKTSRCTGHLHNQTDYLNTARFLEI